jgi:hypothetical protein
MSPEGPPEERVIYRQRFQAQYFDFRGKSIFTRYDGCEFVRCMLLIDHGTEQLAFTECVFKTATSINWNRMKSAGCMCGIISSIAR